MASSEIPYATEQRIISKKEANLIHEQGIFPVKFEIHCQTADLNRHRWPSWTRLEKVGPKPAPITFHNLSFCECAAP
jgi:hypothetical protein